jgi:single-stranded DNA-binding protein
MSLNVVNLVGRVGGDPDVKYFGAIRWVGNQSPEIGCHSQA